MAYCFNLKLLEKQKQTKFKASRKSIEIMNIWAEINEIETKKYKESMKKKLFL
jgi:hypothetical protein